MKKKENNSDSALLNIIIDAIQEKKGKDIVTIDLRGIDHAICDYFVICQGDSGTQVGAIASSIEEMTEKNAKTKPRNIEGTQNAQWILIDFFNIVVHVFQKDVRSFYRLEELWSDGKFQEVKDL